MLLSHFSTSEVVAGAGAPRQWRLRKRPLRILVRFICEHRVQIKDFDPPALLVIVGGGRPAEARIESVVVSAHVIILQVVKNLIGSLVRAQARELVLLIVVEGLVNELLLGLLAEEDDRRRTLPRISTVTGARHAFPLACCRTLLTPGLLLNRFHDGVGHGDRLLVFSYRDTLF